MMVLPFSTVRCYSGRIFGWSTTAFRVSANFYGFMEGGRGDTKQICI